MPKFLIRLHGENYRIGIEERVSLFRKRVVRWKTVGFYTTRLIDSETADKAFETAVELVEEEVNKIACRTENSTVTLDEIREAEESGGLETSESAFSFYTADDN